MAVSIKGSAPSQVIKANKYGKHLGEEVAHKQAVADVEIKNTHKGQTVHEAQHQEVVHPGMAGECTVSVGGSRTINLGDYNSVKISVSLAMPSAKNDLAATYEFCTDWVSERIAEAVKSTGH